MSPFRVEGFELRESIEPAHPRSTTSDLVFSTSDPAIVVKVLSLGFPLRPATRESFEALLKRQSAITSPHVAKIVGFGFTVDEGAPWFAMERVRGITLLESMEHGDRHAAGRTREILEQLVSAATAAGDGQLSLRHAAFSADGGLRAWNFGVASWRVEAHAAVAGQYTAPGQIKWATELTPNQAAGRKRTAADDLVLLALMSFALRTARHYWNADQDENAAPMQLLMEVMAGANEAPSQRALGMGLSSAYDAWFKACVAGSFANSVEAVRAFPQS